MYREPGIPVYFRAPSRGLITLGFLAFGCVMVYLGARQSWVLVLVLCFGVAVTLLALARMEWAILGLVVMANVDGFLKPLFAERFSLFLKDYFVLLALVRWAWGLLQGEERSSLRTAVAIPAALFIGYVFTELANPNAGSLLASLAGVRAWVLWIPVFFIAYDYMRSKAEIERLWILVTVVSGLVAVYGVVQYIIGFEHLYALSPRFEIYTKSAYVVESGGRIIRVFSTMVHAGTFGGAMAFAVLVASALALATRSEAIRLLALLCGGLAAIGLVLSGSRTAMIGASVGLGVLFLLARRPGLLLVAGLVLLVGFWQAARITEGAAEQRLESVRWDYVLPRVVEPFMDGLDIATTHPLGLGVASGVGTGSFDPDVAGKSAIFIENDFGRALAELGLPGAVLYVLLLAASGFGALSAYFRIRDPAAATLGAALVGGLAMVALGLLLGAALYLAPGAPYFWLALASVMRLPEAEEVPARGRTIGGAAPDVE